MPAKTEDRPETKGRPTLYKGIRMRSRLEAAYAAYLDRLQVSWEYEPECFASARGQWLPDFSFVGAPGRYIEVKPPELLDFRPHETADERYARIDTILGRMAIAWESQPEARVELVFFDYERSEPHATIAAMRRSPWFVLVPNSGAYQTIWGGMGQWKALPPANPHYLAEAADDAR